MVFPPPLSALTESLFESKLALLRKPPGPRWHNFRVGGGVGRVSWVSVSELHGKKASWRPASAKQAKNSWEQEIEAPYNGIVGLELVSKHAKPLSCSTPHGKTLRHMVRES